MSITTLFFDLDNTLYPSDNSIWASIGNRMNIFIKDQLNLPDDKVISLRHSYYEKYGTTLRGLQIHHSIDADEFLDYVHDLPIEEMIQPDPELRVLLLNLPKRKFIFTNSNIEHAERVLQSLHIAECFDEIIDVRAMDFQCKPNLEAYHIALKLAAGDNPSNCIFLDDSVRNLTPAFEQGFYTILIGTTDSHPVAYHSLKRPHDLQHVMPDLWNQ
jgi:pyrimidine 5'-nucleotidase